MLCHPKGDKLLALEKLWDNREKVLSTFDHKTGETLMIPEQFKVELSNVYDILEPSEEEGGAGLRFDHLLCKQKEGSDYLLHRIGETDSVSPGTKLSPMFGYVTVTVFSISS